MWNWCWYRCFTLDTLIRDNMAAISQMVLSNAFSWMKTFEFQIIFHWHVYCRVQLVICYHWFRQWPLFEPLLTYHQWGPLLSIPRKFQRKFQVTNHQNGFENYTLQRTATFPGSTELTLIIRHTNIVCYLNLKRNKSCDSKSSRTVVLMLNCCSIIWSTTSTERQWELIACSTHSHLKYCHLNAIDHFNKFQVSI